MFRVVLLFAAVAAGGRAAPWIRAPISAQEVAQGYRNDAVIARPSPEHAATIDAEEAQDGATARQVFPHLRGIRVLQVKPGETPAAAIARLQATGRYAYVEVDRIVHGFGTTPNDPDFSQQWGLNNTGINDPEGGLGIAGADIHAPAAWNLRTSAAQIVVATVDTGLLLTHDDIVANLWTNPQAGSDGYGDDLHGIDAVAGAADPGDPTDDNGHGTHVAGIIGAVGNNGLDTSGIAWNVQLMPLKFLDADNNGSTSAEDACLEFAVAHGANLINASFGSPVPSQSEQDAIESLQSAGIIMVCAAGNNATSNDQAGDYPAGYALDNVIAVAASDSRDDLALFSDYGSGSVEIAAPGEDILSLYNTSNTATAVLDGTSMATPMVTGSLALLKAQFPGDTYRQLINRLLRHADPLANLLYRVQTGGRVDLAAALSSAATDNTPFNDDFAARGHLSGSTVTVRTNNTGATREANEPGSANASLWWDWTAPFTGTVTIASVSGVARTNLLPVIGVYTGTALESLTAIGTASGSVLSIPVQAGVTYDLTVGSETATTGPIFLTLSYGNISTATAVTLSGPSPAVTGSIPSEGAQGQYPGTEYYQWTATASGTVQAIASSPDLDPTLALSQSANGGSQTLASASGPPINSNAEAPVSNATLSFQATAGTTYYFAVSGVPDAAKQNATMGQFTLAINDARWAATTSDQIWGTPAVGPDGTIYIGSEDNSLYAFNPDGSKKWSYPAGEPFVDTAPAVGADGTVYAGPAGGSLYALTPAGALKWSFAIAEDSSSGGENSIACSPTVGADGTIYVKDAENTLYAINPNGTQKWTATVPGGGYAAPVIAADGTIYEGCDAGGGAGTMYAFNADGSTKWTFAAQGPIYTAAAIDGSGNIYFGTLGGAVYAVSPGGQQLWTYTAANSISSSPVIGADGTVYFGCYDHNLYALTSAGALKWTCLLGNEVRTSSPALDSNGVIYVGCLDGLIYAVNPDGTLNRTYATAGVVRSSPAISGTTMYSGSSDWRLYAFDLGASAASAPWPTYLAETQRLGRALSAPLAVTGQPAPSVVLTPGSGLSLTVTAQGEAPLSFQWYLDGAAIAGATQSTYFVPSATAANDGTYTVVVSGPQGSIASAPAEVGPSGAPAIATPPQSATVSTGGNLTLTVIATGGNLTYQWSFAGSPIAGATGSSLALTNIGADQGNSYGSYTVAVANSFGTATSAPATVTVVTQAQLLNLSARADVQSGQNDLKAGFVIGNGGKQVVLRGIGPALAGFDVTGPLANPVLTLYANASQAELSSNAGWDASLAAAFAQVGAFALTPGSADSALLQTLSSGAYSIHVDGANGESGVALAEIYDDDQGATSSRLVNISASALVGTDDLYGGFVISGSTSETVLLRGVGPTLGAAPFSFSGVLAQPQLTLYDKSGDVLFSNSGWGGDSSLAAVASAVGAFALQPNSADAALLVTLAPGSYTVEVGGLSGSSGTALVEVYEVR